MSSGNDIKTHRYCRTTSYNLHPTYTPQHNFVLHHRIMSDKYIPPFARRGGGREKAREGRHTAPFQQPFTHKSDTTPSRNSIFAGLLFGNKNKQFVHRPKCLIFDYFTASTHAQGRHTSRTPPTICEVSCDRGRIFPLNYLPNDGLINPQSSRMPLCLEK